MIYYDDCDDWLDLPAAEQTWANFQTHFTAAHRKAKRKQRTTQSEGYHGANASLQIDTALQSENEATIDALANMATVMSADRATMSQLTKSISELTAQLTAKDNEIASLKNRPRNNNSNNNSNTSRNSNNNDRHQPTWRSHNASPMATWLPSLQAEPQQCQLPLEGRWPQGRSHPKQQLGRQPTRKAQCLT
jgi:hypothetical protein